jgi:ubiquinone/menaquinone biosynthesis C-methylase UbiE/GNAT superfamily N-acetyltransferase
MQTTGGYTMNKFRDITLAHFDKQHLERTQGKDLYELWPNKRGQLLRFGALADIDDLNGKSILDVGCGLGEFYYFCEEKNVNFENYVGVDIHPKVVEQANEKFPELNIVWMDILENDFEANSFDYIIASGLFNVEMEDWYERTRLIVGEFHRICKLGAAMNFLRYREENRNPVSHYEQYENIISIVERFTNRYVVRADYKKNDSTCTSICLNKVIGMLNIKLVQLTYDVCKRHLNEILRLIQYKREMDGHTYDYWKTEHVLKDLPRKWDCSYLAFDNDHMVGFVINYLKSPDELRLSKVFVLGEYRGQGIGSMFLEKFVSYARDNGIKKATTCTADFNQAMMRLLEKHHFVRTFTWESFNKVTYHNYEREIIAGE